MIVIPLMMTHPHSTEKMRTFKFSAERSSCASFPKSGSGPSRAQLTDIRIVHQIIYTLCHFSIIMRCVQYVKPFRNDRFCTVMFEKLANIYQSFILLYYIGVEQCSEIVVS